MECNDLGSDLAVIQAREGKPANRSWHPISALSLQPMLR